MYGAKGRYFDIKTGGLQNSIWIELIGFDNALPDFGVQKYLDTIGFMPDMISLLLTSVDFVNNHCGMETEYRLPAYACSYSGHMNNDERNRQNWTNYQLRKLVLEFKSRGIKVFGSFFDLDSSSGLPNLPMFSEVHPELSAKSQNTAIYGRGILMIKRFADGTLYEDYLLKKLIETAKDYEWDGIQLADGISSPRETIWAADFSKDIIEQSGIEVPDGVDAAEYISNHKRNELINFYRMRWTAFIKKIIIGLKEANFFVAVNSAWTRDPLEAIYSYGADYDAFNKAGVDAIIVEDVSANLAILGYEDNGNYHMDYKHRRFIHSEFLANLMCIKAHMGETSVWSLFPLWDNMEQWDVLHHSSTAMQRVAAANLNHFCFFDGKYIPVTNGPHFCLGDAIKSKDWDDIRLCWDNGYTENPIDIPGVTFIWSAGRMENEIRGLINHGLTHSAVWLAHLLRHGAQIGKIVNICYLEKVTGDIVVTNPSYLPKDEAIAIRNYNQGMVIYAEAPTSINVSKINNSARWPRPLKFTPIDEILIKEIVHKINKYLISIEWGADECNAWEVRTGSNSSRIFVENEEYYYVLPEIRTLRPIKDIKVITKPLGYPLKYSEKSFKLRVPPRGLDVVEIIYE